MPHRYIIPTLSRSAFSITALLLFGSSSIAINPGCGPSIEDSMIGGVGPATDVGFDFPAGPSTDGTIPSSILPGLASAFGSAPSSMSGGPCMTEPTLDAMYPLNFNPPVFEWKAPSPQNVFELRLHIDNQTNDLVLYTSKSTYTIPTTIWNGLVQHSAGRDVQVTVRGAQQMGSNLVGSVSTGTSGMVHIAPVSAPGSIVYWTTSGGSAFKGFRIGDSVPRVVLTPQSMRTATPTDNTQCVGCHTSSPDGLLAVMGRSPNSAAFPFTLDARLVDGSAKRPAANVVSDSAFANLGMYTGWSPTFSPAHYSDTDAFMISVSGTLDSVSGRVTSVSNLVWNDLHATSTTTGIGIVARQGDSNSADTPSFSKDGTLIAYSSATHVAIDPRSSINDIYTVPWNGGAGGTATPLSGASDINYNEYYPAYSPGDAFLAFNRGPGGQSVYDSPSSEVFIVPGKGGQATRVRANDPPACLGKTSPGLTNSYPRWAPQAVRFGDRNYYWMVFSSRRRVDPISGQSLPQLYLSVIVTNSSSGTEVLEQTYPAIYLPAQVGSESNHTPAWDVFQIPGAG